MGIKELATAILSTAVASVSAGYFFGFGLGYGSGVAITAAVIVFVFWLAFSFWLSRISGLEFGKAAFRDSLSYIPFALLLLWPLSSAIPTASVTNWGNFDVAALAANLFLKLLLALSLVLCVAVKVLAMPNAVHDAVLSRLPRARPQKVLALMCVLYFVVMFSLSVIRFLKFNTPAPDLWIFNQAMWNTLNGDFMVTTRTLGLGNQVLLGNHFLLILLIILPLYALFQHPLGLYLIESVFITVAAVPVYWIARSELGTARAGLVFAAAFLLFPALQFLHLAEFQPLAFSIPFLLFAFHCLKQNRMRLFWLCTALALSVRETLALVVFMFGLYIALAMRRMRIGALVCLVSAAWFLLTVLVFIPSLGESYQYVGGAVNMFANLGSSQQEIFSNVISDPLMIVREATTVQDLGYLAMLLLPLYLLPLLSSAVLVTLPILGVNLLCSVPSCATIYFQYNAELIAFLFIAAVLGAKRFCRVASRCFPEARVRNALLSGVLASSVFSAVLFGPSPLSLFDPAPNEATFSIDDYIITPHHELLHRAVASIPGDASVSADSAIAAHLSSRRELYYFPERLGTIDYVLLDTSVPEHYSALHPEVVAELRAYTEFEKLIDSDGVLLFRRVH